MYTVFVNDQPFRFAGAYEAAEWKGNTKSIFIAEKEMSITDALDDLEESHNHPGFIYLASNPEIAWQLFISKCTLIEAAGGLVANENEEYLIIFRKGKYDLPKGKIDYDESPEQGALREVEEECGTHNLEIIKPLEKTFHTYNQHGKRMLKKTNWFLMKTVSQPLTPQLDEDIQKAEWMTAVQIKETALKNMYASIAELLRNNLED